MNLVPFHIIFSCSNLGGEPNDRQEGQDKIVQLKFDERFRSQGIEVGVFAEKEVGDGGGQNEEESILERG